MNKIINLITSIPFMVMASLASTVTSIDIYMPCMPMMADCFYSTAYMMQLSIGMGIIGSSLVTPFIGPLSDSIGRRQILIIGHSLYTLSVLACGFATTVEQLICFRFLTGLFSATSSVLSFAIIADRFRGEKLVLYYAYITTTITLSLVIAPLIGGYIADNYQWYVCFFSLALFSSIISILLIWKLPETLSHTRRFSLKKTLSTYKKIVTSRRFMVMALIPSLMISGIITYMSCASFYFINELHVCAAHYSFYQAVIMICNSVFSYVAGLSIAKLGFKGTTKWGMIIFASGGFGFLLAAILTPQMPVILTFTIALFSSGIGFVFAAISAEAMGLFPESSGATSSMITFTRGIIIAVVVYIGGAIYNGSIVSIALLIALITLITLGLYYFLKRTAVSLQ